MYRSLEVSDEDEGGRHREDWKVEVEMERHYLLREGECALTDIDVPTLEKEPRKNREIKRKSRILNETSQVYMWYINRIAMKLSTNRKGKKAEEEHKRT